MTAIPLNSPVHQYAELHEEIDRVVREVSSSGHWLDGPWTRRFSEQFARWSGVEYCVPLANGTDALELALRGLGVGTGDEVITVANAGGYATAACRLVGATPTWIDVVPTTLGLDITRAVEALSDRTKVIVVTHLYGIMVDVLALRAELDQRGWSHVRILEDCAQAHGAVMHGRKAGSFGDVATFSFYPTKNLGALGDAGAVLTNDAEIADRVARLRQYGWSKRFHSAVPMGRNSRMDEVQAAILTVKLPHLERWNAMRRQIIARLARDIHPPTRVVGTSGESNVAYLAVVRTPWPDQLRGLLATEDIATDIHYPVLDCDQASQMAMPGRRPPLPESERAVDEIVTLPCYPALTTAQLDKIIMAVNRVCSRS